PHSPPIHAATSGLPPPLFGGRAATDHRGRPHMSIARVRLASTRWVFAPVDSRKDSAHEIGGPHRERSAPERTSSAPKPRTFGRGFVSRTEVLGATATHQRQPAARRISNPVPRRSPGRFSGLARF